MYDHLPEVQYWLSEMDRKLENLVHQPVQVHTYRGPRRRLGNTRYN